MSQAPTPTAMAQTMAMKIQNMVAPRIDGGDCARRHGRPYSCSFRRLRGHGRGTPANDQTRADGHVGMTSVSVHGPTGVLLVDGRKVFPIGLSDPPPLGALAPSGQPAFQELANAGATMIRTGT